ncbi:MAG: DUF86 domain-containing protein [Candidatus Hydrogenedentota bacterium]
MSRDWRYVLKDIRVSCEKIGRFIEGLDYDAFVHDARTYDAVIRNLEIIGEATRLARAELISAAPEIEWRKIVELRNIVAHQYFGIDNQIIWDVVTKRVPELIGVLRRIERTLP